MTMNLKARTAFFERLRAQNPNPTTELNYNSNFELLIAVLLSAQSTDVRVNLVTKPLFDVANTAELMLDLGLAQVEHLIQTLGLYRAKAKHVIQTCEILVNQYHGQVPSTRAELEALPGVGRKTANVVLNTAFGQPVMAVDTHIFRVANRTGLASGKTPRSVEDGLMRSIPEPYLKDAHHWLILHGRYICTARKPQCGTCLVQDLCEYSNKSS